MSVSRLTLMVWPCKHLVRVIRVIRVVAALYKGFRVRVKGFE